MLKANSPTFISPKLEESHRTVPPIPVEYDLNASVLQNPFKPEFPTLHYWKCGTG